MELLTIGQVARHCGLSRSTLLYYHSTGLLIPHGRNNANYRLYTNVDLQRLDKIRLFRETGLTLKSIARLLENEADGLDSSLQRRLDTINQEIHGLRTQQQVIVSILKQRGRQSIRSIDKDTWVSLLESAGLDESGMRKWHIAFEHQSPEAHQDFLESIGIADEEISRIREWSKKPSSY